MEIFKIIKEHIAWRHQIFKLAKADIIKTYSGAALGWSWAVIKPSVTIFVFWFAFSVGLRTRGPEGYSFFLWLISGMVAWFYISDMWNQGTGAMRKYSYLITKMKFPISTIPTFVSISKLVIHLGLLAITIVLFMLAGHMPDKYFMQLPFYMLLMFLMATGWALFASVMAAMSKDFWNLVKAFSTAIFWLSGIMWDPYSPAIPYWVKNFLMFNPVTYIVCGYRDSFIYERWFFEQPLLLAIFLGEMIIMWMFAIWAYKKLKEDLPDVL
ncbi:MAG: ABC transporter permease [Eubacteriales bacterium]|jgi:teichoic acid transport system permease protein|nr:ABC transporter permease [Eubacteriales bacterium]NLF47795.1 ABC transporter permease [Clostridiales bacterium]